MASLKEDADFVVRMAWDNPNYTRIWDGLRETVRVAAYAEIAKFVREFKIERVQVEWTPGQRVYVVVIDNIHRYQINVRALADEGAEPIREWFEREFVWIT